MVQLPAPPPEDLIQLYHQLLQLDPRLTLAVNKGKLAMFIDSLGWTLTAKNPGATKEDGYTMEMAIQALVPKGTHPQYIRGAYHAIYGWFCPPGLIQEAVEKWKAWKAA